MSVLIIQRDTNMGDSICSIPAIHRLAEYFGDRETRLIMMNQEVAEIMKWPKYLQDGLGHPGRYARQDLVYTLDLWDAIGHNHWNPGVLDPCNEYIKWVGLPPGDTVPRPQIAVPTIPWVPSYDYVIAPWARDGRRSLDTAEIQELFGHLENKILIGGPTWSMSLAEVVNLMRKARKAVITVDSGPSRLAHAADIPNHVLLATNLTPRHFSWYPGVHMMWAAPHSFDKQSVDKLIEEAACCKK